MTWLWWAFSLALPANAAGKESHSLAAIEQPQGALSPALVEPLVRQADGFIARGQPAAAIEPLRRAVNIIRRSVGLYDLQQYDLLLRAVDVQSQIGEVAAAAEDLAYMKRISESNYAADPLQQARSLAEIGAWQCRVGRFAESRDSYRQSIDKLDGQAEKQMLIAALRGFAQCCLQELAAVGVATTSDLVDSYRGPIVRSQSFDPGNPAFRSNVFRYMRVDGEQALLRAVALSEPLDPQLRIAVLLQAGDWFLAKDFIREARRHYFKADALARAGGVEDTLLAPQQVLYALPPSVLRTRHLPASEVDERFIEVEFTVRADGHVTDEKVIDRGPGKFIINETLAALRAARFRPRIVDGRSLATEGVRLRQRYSQVKAE